MTGGKRGPLAVIAAAGVVLVSALQTIPAAASSTISVDDFKQCANGSPGTVTTPVNSCVSWTNGGLNGNNSQYAEDQVVPNRVVLTQNKTDTVTDHTITISYLDRKGSANAHAYDSLATWNFTVTNADRCQNLSVTCPVGTGTGGSPTTIPIPPDNTSVPPIGSGGNGSAVTSAHQLPNQVFVMYGGTLTSVSAYTHTAAASTGTDDTTSVTVHYTSAAQATVELLFGGHLGAETGPRGWGTGFGSANINGGPYHITLTAADGVTIGSQDNQIQSSAILPQASLTITKTADSGTVNAGSPVGFTITVTNNGTGAATGVSVNDNLPNTGSAWNMSPAVSGCTISGATASQVLSCSNLTINANSALSIHVVSIAANPAACGTLSNTATFSGGGSSGSAGPVSVTVTCPALKVVKTPDAASVSSTQPIGFTITVSNTGNGTATGVTLNDPLPGGTGVNWSINTQPSQGSCSIGGTAPSQTLTCSLGNIAAGGSVSLHIISQTTAQTSGTFNNTATAQATNSPPASGSGSETVLAPSLGVTKTPDAASVSSGSPIGFTITVTNSGSGTALGATLNDPLPTGTGLNWSISPAYTGPGTCSISGTAPAQQTLACTFGNLAPGATLSVHVTSPTTAQTSGTFTNTATAQATNNPPTSGTGSTTVNQPGLHVVKTPDAASVSSGSPIGFTITVSNTSTTGTATSVTLNDPLPSGTGINWSISPAFTGPGTCSISGNPPSQTLACSFGNLAPGASVSVHVVSPTTAGTSGTFTNTATAQGTNTPPTSGTGSTTVLQPSLHVVKTPDAASVSSGQPIGFTITVTNSGQGTATAVTLNDPLPGGTGINWSISPAYTGPGTCSIGGTAPSQTLTCSFGDLAANASASVHVMSATTAQTSGTFNNTATAQGSNTPPTSGSGSTTVLAPGLQVTKTPDAAVVSSGQPIGFTITVTNNGSGTATGATLTDPLPGGTGINWSISPAYTGPGTCSISGTAPSQTLSCSFGNLAAGATLSVHVSSPTTAQTSGTFNNTATAQATNNPPTSGSGSTTVNQPGLKVTKTPDAASVSAGQPIGFTITTTNTGTGTATAVTLTDTLPMATGLNWSISPAYTGPGTCSISGTAPAQQTLNCSFGDLAPNATVTVHVSSPTTTQTSGTIANTAVAQATNNPPTSGTGSTTVNQPNLAVTKTPDAAQVSSGQPIGFTITVTNSGAGTATGATLTDTLPVAPGLNWSISPAYTGPGTCSISGTAPAQQTLSCSFGDLAPNATLSVHVSSPTTAQTSGTITNTAVAQATNNPPTSGTGSTTVNQPNLAVTKTPDAAQVSSGQPIGFTITVSNTSTNGTATGVTLNDPLPTGTGLNWSISPAYTGPGTCSISGTAPAQQTLTCSFGDLAPGATVSVHVLSPTATGTSGTFTNTATAQATNNPPTSGTGSTTVNQPNLQVVKTPDAPSVSSGQPIGFTITVSNTATAGTATAVMLNDPLPVAPGLNWSISPAYTGPGTCSITGTAPAQQTLACSFGDLAPGASVSVHVVSPTTGQTSGVISNTATAQGSNTPPTSGTGSTTVNQPTLHISKTADSSSVSAGQPIGFTITISNSGPGTATNVTVNDTLPNNPGLNWSVASITPAPTPPDGCTITGTPQVLNCSFASLAPNQSIAIDVTSPTTSATCGAVNNTATVNAGNAPSAVTSAGATVTVNCPNVTIMKTADQSSVSAGQQIGFTVTLANSGPGTATNVTLTDTLPNSPGLSWSIASVTPALTGGDQCSISTTNPQVLTCTFASLAPNASVAVDVVSPTTAATCGTVSNSASETTGNGGSATTPAPVTVTVNCPNVIVAKTADSGSVNEGQQIGFTVTVTNTGPGTATNVTLTDTLPNSPGLSWSIASVTPALPGGDACSISTTNPQVLTCTFASLAPNASEAIHIVSPTTAASCGTITNVASATVGNGGSATTPAPVPITINCAALHVSKTACPTSIPPGGTLTYTINYSNTGAPATNVVLTDTIPAGTQVANAGGGTVGNGTVTWNIGNLATNGSGSKTLQLLVTAANGTTLVNTVTLTSPSASATATFTLKTLVSNAGAITHGNAYGVEINALGLEIVNKLGQVSTVAPGSPQFAASNLAVIPVPGILTATLVRQTSDSGVTTQAHSTATSTVVGLNLLSGAITADAIKGVSQSVASATDASSNSTGSNFANLVLQGAKGPVDLTNAAPNTSFTLYNPLTPSQRLANVVLYEQSKPNGTLSGGMWTTSHFVNMIDLSLLVPFGTLPAGAHIIVAHAQSDATYPSGLACGTVPNTVSGKAFTVFVNGTFLNNNLVTTQVGNAVLSPTGGSSSDQILAQTLTGIESTGTGQNATSGTTSPTPNATASSVVQNVNLLGGLVTADLIDVNSTSSATGTAASTTYGSTCGISQTCASGCKSTSPCFVNLAVNGTSIVGVNGGTITPNTTIAIPQPNGSIILVILNEQITNGDGKSNTTGTINAIHIFVLQNSGIVSAEVIVASAHSDAHHF